MKSIPPIVESTKLPGLHAGSTLPRNSTNFIFDDLVHVVYSQNLLLKNCKITDALFDAIDIDISDVIIENCK